MSKGEKLKIGKVFSTAIGLRILHYACLLQTRGR